MIHELWETKAWKTAMDEQIIAALFNRLEHPCLLDMNWILQNRLHCMRMFLHLRYDGNVSEHIKRLTY